MGRAVMLAVLFGCVAAMSVSSPSRARASAPPESGRRVYVILWFDTEDYILPQSDDAAKRIADMLTKLGVRATFKVVGEKARTLERRGRSDVIAALNRHEIGYHANTHSQHPTPAEYEEPLGWNEGVREFERREGGGFADVARIFGHRPTCYGQPGSSWAPQSFGALRKWGVGVYLDEAGQVGLDGKPFWYGGLLNIFNTREGGRIRANTTWSNLEDAKKEFAGFYRKMSDTGGIVSIFFHPCEFVHAQFWDGVNFSRGANPPPDQWKLPPTVPKEEQERRFKYLEAMVRYLKAYPHVRFVTASQAAKLYEDRAMGREYTTDEIRELAVSVGTEIGFQSLRGYTLSPSDVFALLTRRAAAAIRHPGASDDVRLDRTPFGPAGPFAGTPAADGVSVPLRQFSRAVLDVDDYLRVNGRIPSVVWFGSASTSPEGYLAALAALIPHLEGGERRPAAIRVPAAVLATAKYVADDKPSLWNWVIFPEGFHAPNLMALARLQAWTLKPAVLHEE